MELYDQGKITREIEKELRMSLGDIGFILKRGQVNHGIAAIMDNGNNGSNNHKPSNEKATPAYKLSSEGKKPVDATIQLSLSEKEATRYYGILEAKAPIQFISYLSGLKRRSFLHSKAKHVSKKTRNNS